MKKAKQLGTMHFWLDDDRETEFNESISCDFPLYGKENDEIMSIEHYWCLCRYFAAAMGFGDSTIKEWFGEY